MLDAAAEGNFLVRINCGSLFQGLAESVDISRYISHWAQRGCEIATGENVCTGEMGRDRLKV